MTKRYARIKENASAIFVREARKTFRNVPLPLTYQDYAESLRLLAGKTLAVGKEYDDRVVLMYAEPKIGEDGKRLVGIDLNVELVEWV